MADELLQAIENIKAGKKAEGGRALAGLVKANPDNEVAWQWLSVCVRPEEQKRHCLQQVLRINPQNEQASKMLETLDFEPMFEIDTQPAQAQLVQSSTANQAEKLMRAGNLLQRIGCLMTSAVIFVPIIVVVVIFLWGMLTAK